MPLRHRRLLPSRHHRRNRSIDHSPVGRMGADAFRVHPCPFSSLAQLKASQMPIVRPLNGHTPSFGKENFLAETAVIVGDVQMGDGCSVWYNAVLRGDVNFIRIGHRVNIQDNATLHCTYQKCGLTIGNDVSIGHNAVVHGCTVEDKVLIGMGAIVMDQAVIGAGSVIAAGAVVTQGTVVPPGSLMAGVPAKRIGAVGKALAEGEIERIARNYGLYASWYGEGHNS